jgi:hypothetical protein
MTTIRKGRKIQVFEEPNTGALSVSVDGQKLRGRTFLWERDALSWAITHIDQESAQ